MASSSTSGDMPIEPPAAPGDPSSFPPLPKSPPPESVRRPTRTRAAARAPVVDRMLERLAASDYEGALTAAEALLAHQPQDEDARDCAQMARSELRKLYVARLGSLGRIPYVSVALQSLLVLPLDVRAGLLLSRIDRRLSLEQIVEACGLPELDAFRILSELYLRRVIDLEDGVPG